MMEDNVVMKNRIASVLTEFAENYPEFSPAVANAKADCLEEAVKPQGIHLNCPGYDVSYCMYVRFLRVSFNKKN